MSKLIKIFAWTVVISITITLFVFFYPAYSGDTEDIALEKVFINKYQKINSMYDYSAFEQGHPIGEPFYLVIRIQYRHEEIELLPESFQNANFYPFEKTGNENIDIKYIEEKEDGKEEEEGKEEKKEEISELIYSIELIAIQAIPGEAYILERIPLEYRDKEQDIVRIYNIVDTRSLHVGKRLADNLETAISNPLKGLLSKNSIEKTLGYLAAAFVPFVVMSIIITNWVKLYVKEKRGEVVNYRKVIKKIRNRISEYKNEEWVNKKLLDVRMNELEEISIRLAYYREIIFNLGEFWNHAQPELKEEENILWADLIGLFEKAYSKEDISIENIHNAVNIITELFLNKENNERIARHLNSIFSQRNGKEGGK